MNAKMDARRKYNISFDVLDLKSFKRSAPNHGWAYIIFILKDGTTYPALHFHSGGSKALLRDLEQFVHIRRWVSQCIPVGQIHIMMTAWDNSMMVHSNCSSNLSSGRPSFCPPVTLCFLSTSKKLKDPKISSEKRIISKLNISIITKTKLLWRSIIAPCVAQSSKTSHFAVQSCFP